MYCTKCGHAAKPGAKYCHMCGTKLAAETVAQAPIPPAPEAAVPITKPKLPRTCTKCGVELENDILFCPACGTKNYVAQSNKSRKGELLIELENCSLVKLQILKNPGAILLYDDKLFFKAAAAGNNLMLPYADLASVATQSGINYKYGIKLSSTTGKIYQFCLPDCYADSYPYVISLILDYIQ